MTDRLTSLQVESDLECARCGYNLRTIAWTGNCPECRTPTTFSRLPDEFTFQSPSAIRSVRRGLIVLILGILLAALARIEFTLLLRYALPLELPKVLWRVAARIWAYGNRLSCVVVVLAIWSIVLPLAPNRPRRARRFARIVTLLAMASLLPCALDIAAPNALWRRPHDTASLVIAITETVLAIGLPAALLLTLLYVRRHINSSHRSTLSRTAGLAVIAQAVIFAGTLVAAFGTALDELIWRYHTSPPLFTGMAISSKSPWYTWNEFAYQTLSVADFWEHHVGDACRLVIVVAASSLLHALPAYRKEGVDRNSRGASPAETG